MIPYNDIKQDDPRLRPIPGFQDYYVDEELGNIWSFKHDIPKILKPSQSRSGPQVALFNNGVPSRRGIRRLVLNVTDPKIKVVPLDRDEQNTTISNLEAVPAGLRRAVNGIYTKTGFKGVHINQYGKFIVKVKFKELKQTSLGTYHNIYEAAAVMNMAISKKYGHHGIYNKVDGHILTL